MPEAPAVDPMLQLFVRLMNNLDVQLGLTVLVGGSWVTGILIPPRTFTEESGAELVEKAGAEAEGLQVFFRELGRHWFPSDAELEAEKEAGTGPERDDRPFHLHLRKARMVSTTGTIPLDGAYMRIRLADDRRLGDRRLLRHPPLPPPDAPPAHRLVGVGGASAGHAPTAAGVRPARKEGSVTEEADGTSKVSSLVAAAKGALAKVTDAVTKVVKKDDDGPATPPVAEKKPSENARKMKDAVDAARKAQDDD